jgi:hypothetical protein
MGSPLLAITCQIDLLFPAGPGVDFSRASWDPKGVLVTVGAQLATEPGKGRRWASSPSSASRHRRRSPQGYLREGNHAPSMN